jgi:purine nucleosidase/pyrimidine-specific ribonucleoside hydrolase
MHLVIDTDPGIDDALALLLALGSPGARVLAITTVAGNVDVDRATLNVFRILHAARPAAPPRVAKGASAPLRRPLVTAPAVHGDDGLGGLDRHREPDGRPRYPEPPSPLEMQDGADLILEMAARHGADLTLVALGPLTNVALALDRDPLVLRSIGRLVVMGGAVAVPGNVTPAAEFNFYVDPEAAAAVLGAGLPVEMVPLDVTRRAVLAERDLAARLAGADSPLARLVADFTDHGLRFARARRAAGMALHDPLAVGVALDPSLVAFEPLCVEVECEGRLTRGLSLADRRPGADRGRGAASARVAMDVDAPRFLRLFLERLCPASS